jgi:hypothetical protein
VDEYELFDIATSYQELGNAWITVFITAFTAYLVVAYAVGRKLSTFQVMVISSCFIIFSSLCIFGAYGTMVQCIRLYEEIMRLNPTRQFFLTMPVAVVSVAILCSGVVVAVWFMFNTRRQRIEQSGHK